MQRDGGSIPGLGRSPGGGHDNSLEYSCLENRINREAWCAAVCGVSKSRAQLKPRTTHACPHVPASPSCTHLPLPLSPWAPRAAPAASAEPQTLCFQEPSFVLGPCSPNTTLGPAGTTLDVVEVESYDPFTDTWTPIRPALKYVSNFSAAGCGGRLYLVGSSACKYNALALQCYNPVTGVEGDRGCGWGWGRPAGPRGWAQVASGPLCKAVTPSQPLGGLGGPGDRCGQQGQGAGSRRPLTKGHGPPYPSDGWGGGGRQGPTGFTGTEPQPPTV